MCLLRAILAMKTTSKQRNLEAWSLVDGVTVKVKPRLGQSVRVPPDGTTHYFS